ncbi:MAG: hypothetical protein EWV80_11255 [Microcystis aeruginosa Ma_QC_B_20070730_S2]|jgi:hypothetical protein|uniref:Uncharacterized protein n=2 Tax=Microcystis aeruginosa TaxID=1126 RepID=A0A552DQ68_MICAE|nr:MAG: hypothetical protein EWV80_11255 [Microcystis aeruginosa Ma_QC_B_20070730_S2]TRU28416.1 MAG: hypothetical protein EWV81_05150 [Microcystis aeruginosa Ma_SC_T_19800800_S464]
MSDFGIGNVVGKVAGKLANAANSSQELMCIGKCGKITKHISIGYADAALSKCSHRGRGEGEQVFSSVVGTLGDFFPGSPLVVGNPYACTHCNKIRVHGGALSDIMNKKLEYYLKKK